jgi:hypothetical protein
MIVCSGFVLLLAIVVGVGRFCIPGHNLTIAGTYEAFAHIWVGMALVIAIGYWEIPVGKVCAALLGLLTVIEIVMFLLR